MSKYYELGILLLFIFGVSCSNNHSSDFSLRNKSFAINSETKEAFQVIFPANICYSFQEEWSFPEQENLYTAQYIDLKNESIKNAIQKIGQIYKVKIIIPQDKNLEAAAFNYPDITIKGNHNLKFCLFYLISIMQEHSLPRATLPDKFRTTATQSRTVAIIKKDAIEIIAVFYVE